MSNQSISNAFRTDTYSIEQYFKETNVFLIPAYQRKYRWDEEKVDDLLGDTIEGINYCNLNKSMNYNYLGNLITFHDNTHDYIIEQYNQFMPDDVRHLIDGQQRISTFILINIAILQIFKEFLLEKKVEYNEISFLKPFIEEIESVYKECYKFIYLDRYKGDSPYSFYPKIIRQHEDQWAYNGDVIKYNSPIAHLIWNYIIYEEKKDDTVFKYEPSDDFFLEHGKSVYTNFKYITSFFNDFHKNNPIPVRSILINKQIFKQLFFQNNLSDDDIENINRKISNNLELNNVLQLLVFYKFFNKYNVFSQIRALNEESAFEMFQSLNTTGEPLTPIETFKPTVVKATSKFDGSNLDIYFSKIEKYLQTYDNKQISDKTFELIISFHLSEIGKKIRKNINSHRRWLKDTFDKYNLEQKEDFLKRFSYTATFFQNLWYKESTDFKIIFNLEDDNETNICFQLLKEMNHKITIGILVLFYSKINDSNSESSRSENITEFLGAIRATASFSTIWRTFYGSTKSIDTLYTKILSEHLDGYRNTPFSAYKKDISLEAYKAYLNKFLTDHGLINKEDWIDISKDIPIYHFNQKVTKFLLFCSYDRSYPDENNYGLIKYSRPEYNLMMSLDKWNKYNSIEHVAPQDKSSQGWDTKIYSNDKIVNKIGNLTLLPIYENIIVGNKTWDKKRLYYKIFSTKELNILDELFNFAEQEDLKINQDQKHLIEKHGYLDTAACISKYDKDWDTEIIDKRSINLLDLAWNKLIKWLQ